jgi:hypothetical protein
MQMKLWSGVVTEKVMESREFYVRLFGCEVIYEDEGGWFVLLQLGKSQLGFMIIQPLGSVADHSLPEAVNVNKRNISNSASCHPHIIRITISGILKESFRKMCRKTVEPNDPTHTSFRPCKQLSSRDLSRIF